jgi:hypothetical protein
VIDLVWHIIPIETRDRVVFVASTDSRRGQSQAGDRNCCDVFCSRRCRDSKTMMYVVTR